MADLNRVRWVVGTLAERENLNPQAREDLPGREWALAKVGKEPQRGSGGIGERWAGLEQDLGDLV